MAGGRGEVGVCEFELWLLLFLQLFVCVFILTFSLLRNLISPPTIGKKTRIPNQMLAKFRNVSTFM